MDEKKAKFAFAKVKDDILSLRSQLNDLENQIDKINKNLILNEDVKKQINEIKKFNLDKFVKNMDSEISTINSLIKDFNNKFDNNSKIMENFNNQLTTYNREFSDFKKKALTQKKDNNKSEINSLNNKFEEFQDLINEKINLEVSQLRLELTTDIATLYEKILENEQLIQETKKVTSKKKK